MTIEDFQNCSKIGAFPDRLNLTKHILYGIAFVGVFNLFQFVSPISGPSQSQSWGKFDPLWQRLWDPGRGWHHCAEGTPVAELASNECSLEVSSVFTNISLRSVRFMDMIWHVTGLFLPNISYFQIRMRTSPHSAAQWLRPWAAVSGCSPSAPETSLFLPPPGWISPSLID